MVCGGGGVPDRSVVGVVVWCGGADRSRLCRSRILTRVNPNNNLSGVVDTSFLCVCLFVCLFRISCIMYRVSCIVYRVSCIVFRISRERG